MVCLRYQISSLIIVALVLVGLSASQLTNGFALISSNK
jgi:hypothetical protein